MTCKDKCIQYETRLDMWSQVRALELSTSWGCCSQNQDCIACYTSQNTFPICVHCKRNESWGHAHIANDEQFKMKARGICAWQRINNSKWKLGHSHIAKDEQFKMRAGATDQQSKWELGAMRTLQKINNSKRKLGTCALNVKVWHVLMYPRRVSGLRKVQHVGAIAGQSTMGLYFKVARVLGRTQGKVSSHKLEGWGRTCSHKKVMCSYPWGNSTFARRYKAISRPRGWGDSNTNQYFDHILSLDSETKEGIINWKSERQSLTSIQGRRDCQVRQGKASSCVPEGWCRTRSHKR